ncbi:MAG: flagellar motor protein MotB [Mariprofundales bacterium]|nr:flagellar motor protein MotB [Mariprofundales bacterium]
MAKRKKPQEPEVLPDPEAWMTTFADLVSLMLTFFILLLSMSSLDETGLKDISSFFQNAVSIMNPGAGTEIDIKPPLDLSKKMPPKEMVLAMRQNSHAILANSVLEQKVKGIIIKNKLYLRINDAVLFDAGSAKLKPKTEEALKRLAKMLVSSPGKITINGHANRNSAESSTLYPDPWSLTLARAAAVLHLFEQEGVNPARMSIAGYGPSKPISVDSTPFGRNLNRRVEIVVYQ